MTEDTKIFLQYLDTAEIVYKDNICITNMNTRIHKYDMLPNEIKDVAINPNHTFTVRFKNGEKCIFELYTKKAHYHSTNDIKLV